ncbi:MAG: translesion DNA synthesis-associated protein ImuA [Sinobacteraceae bacterium]|nr:translesion DNA synthesis-associated protein ImuA [Nevskiaceae bacterium]
MEAKRADSGLDSLLAHPAIWRGTNVAQTEVLATGSAALDERLPGGGWPRSGLIEILLPCAGVGELSVMVPALAAATQHPMARWCIWVAPPLMPFAPALAAHGVVLQRLLMVRDPGSQALWTFEQVLGSGACDIALGWLERVRARDIRRLQLAAERGRTLGVLFRPRKYSREASHATLRMLLEPAVTGMRANLLKSRGGVRGAFELHLPVQEMC